MTDSPLPHAKSDSPTTRRGRRAALAAGATAALGAVGVAMAKPAEAAAGGPMLLGRSNSAGSSATALSSSTTATALGVTGTAGHALIGAAKLNSKFGVIGRNDATTTSGAGGGILAEGHSNLGLLARTTSPNTYGIIARNTSATAGGAGALLAWGTAQPGVVAFTDDPGGTTPALYADGGAGNFAGWMVGAHIVDGDLLPAFNWVGVQDPVNNIDYRPAVSGEDPVHSQSGRATLDGSGSATVSMTAAFLNAADLGNAAATVQLTAMGGAMPNLSAAIPSSADSFTITGGTASGSVSWTVTAPRRPPTITTAAAAAGAKASARPTSPATRRKVRAPSRPSS